MDNRILKPAILNSAIKAQPYPLLFATVSGAHLYGFPSPDSDYDLRGVHLLPLSEVVGLKQGIDTIELTKEIADSQIDLVTHEIKKFCLLLLKRNGYVLEQLYSPLVVLSTPEHQELKGIAAGCITKQHHYHYQGFAKNQWQHIGKSNPIRVKSLLYLYRVLLTGIHLMETGKVEANLNILNQRFRLSYLDELIQCKTKAAETSSIAQIDREYHLNQYEKLQNKLLDTATVSHLPTEPTAKDALHYFLVKLRTSGSLRGKNAD